MKTINIKRFLQFDIGMQVSIIAFTAIIGFLTSRLEWSFMTFYFGLGAWQLLSFFFHLKRRIKQPKLINDYAKGILGALIIGLITGGFAMISEAGFGLFLFYLILMLGAGFLLAVMYIILTVEDLDKINAKIKES